MTQNEILKGRNVLITGGASGIGALLCSTLASQGSNVIIGDINSGEDLISKLRRETGNGNLHYLRLDVTDFSSQQRFFREAATLFGGVIHSVVANAGVSLPNESAAFENPPDYTTGDLDRSPPAVKSMDVNLTGVMHTTHLAISYLTAHKSSTEEKPDRHILLMGSIAGLYDLPIVPLYCASKHGVTGLFRSLRYSAPLKGYRINLICPYFIDTPILGIRGKILMSGSALAKIEDVVDIAVRTISEQSIRGRAFVVTPRATIAEARSLGLQESKTLESDETKDENVETAVWECFDPDDIMYETFARRLMALVNLRTSKKGVFDIIFGTLKAIHWGLSRLAGNKSKSD